MHQDRRTRATPGYWFGKEKALALFAAVPFGPSAGEYMAWYYHGGGQALIGKIYTKHNIKSVMCGTIAASGTLRIRPFLSQGRGPTGGANPASLQRDHTLRDLTAHRIGFGDGLPRFSTLVATPVARLDLRRDLVELTHQIINVILR